MTRLALSFAGSLLLALTLAGCGGDDPSSSADDESTAATEAAPDEASTTDFCAALTGTTVKDGKDVAKLASEIEETGTPEDIPAKERQGFESYLKALNSIDEDATRKDLEKMTDLGLSKKEQGEVQTFLTYAASQCAPAGGGGGGQ